MSENYPDIVKSKVDIVEVIGRSVRLHKKGGRYFGLCPFHGEKTPSFSVNPVKETFQCFGCSESGDVISFIEKFYHKTFKEALAQLAQEVGVELPKYSSKSAAVYKKENNKKTQISKANHVAAQYYQMQLRNNESAVSYLRSRGISGQSARDFSLGFCDSNINAFVDFCAQQGIDLETLLDLGLVKRSAKDNSLYHGFYNRIIFPIKNAQGKVVAFGGRTLDDNRGPKYLNSSESSVFIKHKELYGLYEMLQSRYLSGESEKELIIVEGYLDVISMHKAGIVNALAPLGTAFSETHIKNLSRYSSVHILCFDGDEAGYRACTRVMKEYLKIIKPGLVVKFLITPSNQDPHDIITEHGREVMLSLIKDALSLSEFIWHSITLDKDLTNVDVNMSVNKSIQGLLSNVTDNQYKSSLKGFLEAKLEEYLPRKGYYKNYTQALSNKNNAPILNDPKRLMKHKQDILLTYLIMYPNLYLNFQESLPGISFFTLETHEKIFSSLEEYINKNTALNKEGALAHLENEGLSSALHNIIKSVKISNLDPGPFEDNYGRTAEHFEGFLKGMSSNSENTELVVSGNGLSSLQRSNNIARLKSENRESLQNFNKLSPKG